MTAHVVVFVLLLVVAAAEPGLATLDAGVNETTWTQEPGDQSVQRPLLSPKTGKTGNQAAVLSGNYLETSS